MKYLFVMFLAVTGLSAVQGKQTFVGTIADDICGKDGHARMRMGPTDAECTTACVMAHDAAYVLVDGNNTYRLSDQKKPEPFAGRKASVIGTLDVKSKTIQVESITAAK